MDVNIRFFQAAATAIPTLFIALAVSAKVFHPTEPGGQFAPAGARGAMGAALQIGFFGGAEMLTLAVLLSDKPKLWAALIVGMGLATQLAMLGAATILPATREHAPSHRLKRIGFVTIVIAAFLAPIGSFWLSTSVLLRFRGLDRSLPQEHQGSRLSFGRDEMDALSAGSVPSLIQSV